MKLSKAGRMADALYAQISNFRRHVGHITSANMKFKENQLAGDLTRKIKILNLHLEKNPYDYLAFYVLGYVKHFQNEIGKVS